MMNVEIAHETAKVTFALVDINIGFGVINQFQPGEGLTAPQHKQTQFAPSRPRTAFHHLNPQILARQSHA